MKNKILYWFFDSFPILIIIAVRIVFGFEVAVLSALGVIIYNQKEGLL